MTYLPITDPEIDHAIRVIKSTYGDDVSVVAKKKSLLKFGQSPAVGTASTRYTIWHTGQDNAHETYVADNTNSIDSISSQSTADTSVVTVEGHSMSGGNRTFVTQTATLNGQTRVALGTALNRVTRVAHADQDSTNLVGAIFVYENTSLTSGKPTDTTKIHITVPAGENQSFKASTSLSSVDYWIIKQISAGLAEKSGSNFADVRLEIRQAGGVFKPISKPILCRTGEKERLVFTPPIIAPKNSDIRLTAVASATGQDVVGDIHGYLAIVV